MTAGERRPAPGLRRRLHRARTVAPDTRAWAADWRHAVSLRDGLRLLESMRYVHLDRAEDDYTVCLRTVGDLPVRIRGSSSDAAEVYSVVVDRDHLPPWLASPRAILDVGAGIGLTTAEYLYRFPTARVVAVEPQPELVPIIREHCARWADRLVTIERAVWLDDARPLELRRRSDLSVGASLALATEPPDSAQRSYEQLTVASVTLAAICREHGPFDFAKIDIEGAEVQVLGEAAAWAPGIAAVAVELHPGRTGFGVEEAVRALERAGYEAEGPVPPADERRPWVVGRRARPA